MYNTILISKLGNALISITFFNSYIINTAFSITATDVQMIGYW
jgi:hypothetical protein